MEEVIRIVPKSVKNFLKAYTEKDWQLIEEIRLRTGKNIEVIRTDGLPSSEPSPLFSEQDAAMMLSLLSQHSLYRLEEELRRGYITISGGHRVGIAGRVVVEAGKVKGLREIGSFNIRIAKEKVGVSEPYINAIFKQNKWLNTLIIGPPKTGKTTLLRDLARQISQGIERKGIKARNVAIIDERSEIAGCIRGVPQHHFGCKIDVLDACPKAEGMMMMIRSMSPDVLIVDEIGREEDVHAVMEAVYAGVTVISTVHGTSVRDVVKRPTFKQLITHEAFHSAIELTHVGKIGTNISLAPSALKNNMVIRT
ncbi:stage III sporulation protein AA [Salipaludibacillus sp. LMS25]|jgi:stage III sporulation protein AA|uniref:stage III sporulation protein AA n=1 Tax=Salipaludibacillus sp. LMS25 TaxID=2924031 RepID=UPI0020D0DBF1|nr:stage III sporulation protein AA [Salipaludibacillus sp. LMS25]UTR14477.1 stage III sporulation protein AA [Salipaludibacillus sp. LMS25]